MIRTAALAVAFLPSTAAVHAQAAAGAASGTKIGTINIRQAIVTTAEGKQASTELQSQFSAQQNELEALNKQINDLRQQLAANQTTWGDEQKARVAAQGQKLTAKFDRQNTALQEDVNSAQSEVVDRIGRKMMDVIERYARENGFVAVLEYPAQTTSVVYASTNIDITAEIIKLYDQAYPVKGAPAPATKPAATAPKPLAQPPVTTPKPPAPTKP
jgi:outer membrane protein